MTYDFQNVVIRVLVLKLELTQILIALPLLVVETFDLRKIFFKLLFSFFLESLFGSCVFHSRFVARVYSHPLDYEVGETNAPTLFKFRRKYAADCYTDVLFMRVELIVCKLSFGNGFQKCVRKLVYHFSRKAGLEIILVELAANAYYFTEKLFGICYRHTELTARTDVDNMVARFIPVGKTLRRAPEYDETAIFGHIDYVNRKAFLPSFYFLTIVKHVVSSALVKTRVSAALYYICVVRIGHFYHRVFVSYLIRHANKEHAVIVYVGIAMILLELDNLRFSHKYNLLKGCLQLLYDIA